MLSTGAELVLSRAWAKQCAQVPEVLRFALRSAIFEVSGQTRGGKPLPGQVPKPKLSLSEGPVRDIRERERVRARDQVPPKDQVPSTL